MELTIGEYCQFSMDSQIQMLKEFGIKVFEKEIDDTNISVFYLSKFQVVVFYKNKKVLSIEIILKFSIRNFYESLK